MQASKQSSMHASKKLSKQADKQGSKQASKLQVYKQAIKQESKQAIKHLGGIQLEPCPGGACLFNPGNNFQCTFLNCLWRIDHHSKEISQINSSRAKTGLCKV